MTVIQVFQILKNVHLDFHLFNTELQQVLILLVPTFLQETGLTNMKCELF